MKERLAKRIEFIRVRCEDFYAEHERGIRAIVNVFSVVIVVALLSYFITMCLNPTPALPPAPPTTAPTVTSTNAPATHIPTRTVTATWTKLPPTETATNTPSSTATLAATSSGTPTEKPTLSPTFTSSLTRTATLTLSPSATASVTPSQTPSPSATLPTIPAGRDLTPVKGTQTPLLPNSGLSAQGIQELTRTPTVTATPEPTVTPTSNRITLPEGCTFHSWYAEFGTTFDVMTFHCPPLFEYGGVGQGVSD